MGSIDINLKCFSVIVRRQLSIRSRRALSIEHYLRKAYT